MSNDVPVGYRRPPKGSQFQKGHSGNAKGRPRGIKNLSTDLSEELRERIPILESGRSIKISKQRAVVKTLVAKTLKGDPRAAAVLLNLIFRFLDNETTTEDAYRPLGADDQKMLAILEKRIVFQEKQRY